MDGSLGVIFGGRPPRPRGFWPLPAGVFPSAQSPGNRRTGGGLDVCRIEQTMSADTDPTPRSARQAALDTVTESAARNIPGADFVSITVRKRHDRLVTLTAT